MKFVQSKCVAERFFLVGELTANVDVIDAADFSAVTGLLQYDGRDDPRMTRILDQMYGNLVSPV